MDEDIKRLLKENLELSRDNNKLLHKMRRNAIIGNLLRIVWYVAIIGIPIFIYFQFLDQYLVQLLDVYGGLQGGAEKVREVGDGLGGILQRFNIGQ